MPNGYVDGPNVVPWTSRNQSQLVPLLPMEVMWLLEAAEERLRNASGIPFALATARRLAAFNSVAYCQHENIAAWNCSRSGLIPLLVFRLRYAHSRSKQLCEHYPFVLPLDFSSGFYCLHLQPCSCCCSKQQA